MNGPILIVAAHGDDEAIGCGGVIARFAKEGLAVHVLLLADGESSREAAKNNIDQDSKVDERENMAIAAGKVLGCASVVTKRFPDNRMDSVDLLDVVKVIEAQIDKIKPQTVFTHHGGDVNIDHNIVHNAVLAACRPQPRHCVKNLIYFEVASSTEWQTPEGGNSFQPNYFVDISDNIATKIEALNIYANEMRPFPHPRSIKAITALATWRGASVGVEAAEAFIIGRKILHKEKQ